MKTINHIFISLFILSFGIFLAHYLIVGNGVWGDGQYYYSYLRSAVIDGDLNFENELTHFNRPVEYTITGFAANKYSIGPAILWAPFFLIAHGVIGLIRLIGLIGGSIIPDGYGFPYQMSIGLGSVSYSVVGLWFCYKMCRKYFSKKVSLLAVIGLWSSSNLLFYTSVDPINSHSLSFFASSASLYLLIINRRKSLLKYFLLGLALGILAIIRNQDILYALLIITFILMTEKLSGVLKTTIIILGLLVSFLPQLIVWKIIYGQPANPYLSSGEKFYWLSPKIAAVLFNSTNGLFLYSPILLLSVLGFYFLYKKSKLLSLGGLFLFLSQLYVISSWHYWTQGASYGGRMFISLMPFFIIGFAAFADRYKLLYRKILILILFFTLINIGSIVRFLLNL